MDDETNRQIDAPDVREHSVERINLKTCRFILPKYLVETIGSLHGSKCLKYKKVTRDPEREGFQKQISSIV